MYSILRSVKKKSVFPDLQEFTENSPNSPFPHCFSLPILAFPHVTPFYCGGVAFLKVVTHLVVPQNVLLQKLQKFSQ